jgi:translation initiation factor SUI1
MSEVIIQVVQRNGKKSTTSVIGLATDLDLKKIISHLKKTYKCNGFIANDPKLGEIITLTGDQRENVFKFLVDEQINKAGDITIKGV